MERRKSSRQDHQSGKLRKDVRKKKKQPINQHQAEKEEMSTSTAAKKLKNKHEVFVPEEETIGYRILNFFTVFSAISEYVKCKQCSGAVKFKTESTRGLGFKIMIICSSCDPVLIPASPLIASAYEINRRFFFALRLLGIGLNGAQKFCGIMDLPPPVAQATYDIIVKNISTASSAVFDLLSRKAISEEREAMRDNGIDDDKQLTVSGDGTWKKRGFTSLLGVATLIGLYTSKVVDIIIKCSYCKACEYWTSKENTAEYEEWKASHEEQCSANHEGSAGKMEVDGIKEMFQRSMQRYGVMYTNYIGDGDSKTYKGIVDAKPYGESIQINKK